MALSLDDIIDVKVNITKDTTTGRKFDLLLLLGETDVFSDRIKIYKDTYSMLQDGFLPSDRLYKACQLAFSQSQHPDRIAVGRIEDIITANTAEEGQILLADALELNPQAEVGKYILHSSEASVDEYRLSDIEVAEGQLIVSNTIPNDEILLAEALELNAEAVVGKYLSYSALNTTHWRISETYVEGGLEIIGDEMPDDVIPVGQVNAMSSSVFASGEQAKIAVGKYLYDYHKISETQDSNSYYEIVSNETTTDSMNNLGLDITNKKIRLSYAQNLSSEVTNSDIGKYIDFIGKYAIADEKPVSPPMYIFYQEIVQSWPEDGYSTVTNAHAYNGNVTEDDIGKYIYYDENGTDTYGGGYAVLDSYVPNSRLIVSAYPHSNNEIILSMATLLNENAEIGKYIYHYVSTGEGNIVSESAVEGGLLIIADKTTRKETIEEALAACRAENEEFYVVNICKDMTDEEHIAAGQFCETCSPSAIYAFTTDSATVLTVNENIFTKLKALDLKRTIGQYSTKHQDSIVAILSWALKLLSSNNVNSAFTLKDKIEEGVTPENNVSSIDVKTLKENYGNIYVNRNGFTLFEDGRMSNGYFFDEVAFLDKYKERMQVNIIREMQSQNKIKQTEDGMAILKAKITEVCEEMYANGFIDSGIWKAEPVLNLKTGDTLSNGYKIQSESIDEQSQSDREARIAPPIYVSLKLAGAIHYLTIQIDVNR